MISDNKTRIAVTVSRDMADKLKLMADSMGVSVSQLCSTWIGTYVMTFEKSFGVFQDTLEKSMKGGFSDTTD